MEIRVGDAREYGYEDGYFIEAKGYGETYFSVPPWEEMGYPELAGRFPTREAAKQARARI